MYYCNLVVEIAISLKALNVWTSTVVGCFFLVLASLNAVNYFCLDVVA